MKQKEYDNRNIGIFDSGIGGLSVMKHIVKIMPYENITYFADNINLPYGEKPKKEIIRLTEKAFRFLEKKNIKILVIACNSVCSSVYKVIKDKFPFEIFEIITPNYKQALKVTKNFNIGIIGTTATVSSDIYKEFILLDEPNANVFSLACPKLLPLIEQSPLDLRKINVLLERYLQFFKRKNIDTLLLACTHYAFIKKAIQKHLKKIKVIEPSFSCAKELYKFLHKNKMLAQTKNKSQNFLFVSKDPQKIQIKAESFLKIKIDKVIERK